MKDIKITILVAVDEHWLIGDTSTNKVPWYLPKDLRHFRITTTGDTVGNVMIMGARTYESFGKPLPNRQHVILSRNPDYTVVNGDDTTHLCGSLEEGIKYAANIAGDKEIFLVGGGQVYRQMLSDPILRMMIVKIILTRVKAKFAGNVFFPELSLFDWRETASETSEPDEKNPYGFTIQTLVPFNTAP